MIGKFESPEALLAAYESLEKEFTRRSQRLKQLQTGEAIMLSTEVYGYLLDCEAVARKECDKWISVEDRLPEEGKYVFVLVGKSDPQVACLRKGISKAEREKMAKGELPDPCEIGWSLDCSKIRYTPRSRIWKAYDEEGNNLVPYKWYANGGPMDWYGQDVTYWMPIPEIPKLEVGDDC